jgi:hypothetical protein
MADEDSRPGSRSKNAYGAVAAPRPQTRSSSVHRGFVLMCFNLISLLTILSALSVLGAQVFAIVTISDLSGAHTTPITRLHCSIALFVLCQCTYQVSVANHVTSCCTQLRSLASVCMEWCCVWGLCFARWNGRKPSASSRWYRTGSLEAFAIFCEYLLQLRGAMTCVLPCLGLRVCTLLAATHTMHACPALGLWCLSNKTKRT